MRSPRSASATSPCPPPRSRFGKRSRRRGNDRFDRGDKLLGLCQINPYLVRVGGFQAIVAFYTKFLSLVECAPELRRQRAVSAELTAEPCDDRGVPALRPDTGIFERGARRMKHCIVKPICGSVVIARVKIPLSRRQCTIRLLKKIGRAHAGIPSRTISLAKLGFED